MINFRWALTTLLGIWLFVIQLPVLAQTQYVRVTVLEKLHPQQLVIEDSRDKRRRIIIDSNSALPLWIPDAAAYGVHVTGSDITRSYDGELVISRSGGRLQIVNIVPLESYVQSVVLAELGWSEEQAMQAQAVLARTWALGHLRPEHEYDFGDLTSSQAYKGVIKGVGDIAAVVKPTERQVLMYQEDLIDVFYHARCADRIFSAFEIWGERRYPYLREVILPAAAVLAPVETHWNRRIKKSALQDIFAVQQEMPDDLMLTKQSRQGQIGVAVNDSWYGIDAFRILVNRKLGWNQLRSNDFELYDDSGYVEFKGKGFGHLVGMCQQNAVTLASRGWNYRQILQLFYPGTEIGQDRGH